MPKKCLSEWLLISFYDFLARRVPENVKTACVIQQTTLKGKKTDFHWKVELAKLHIAVINQPRRSCPVWIISQLSLQRLPAPVFSTRNLGGPPTKAQAPFYWLPSRFHHYHFTVRICCGSHFSLSHPRGQSLVIIEKNMRWMRENHLNIVKTKGGNAVSFDSKLTSWALFLCSNCKTKKRCCSCFLIKQKNSVGYYISFIVL